MGGACIYGRTLQSLDNSDGMMAAEIELLQLCTGEGLEILSRVRETVQFDVGQPMGIVTGRVRKYIRFVIKMTVSMVPCGQMTTEVGRYRRQR